MTEYQPGDHVTNDKGWHGTIARVETDQPTADGLYWWVYWRQRQNHAESLVRKQPICGHLTEQLNFVRLTHE